MKISIFHIAIVIIVMCTACHDDEIILSKPGEPLPPVEELQYEISESNVVLTWRLPSQLSADIIQPVSVQVRIAVDGQNAGTHVLPNAPESFTFSPYDPSKAYGFTVKVMGGVDTQDPHVSNLRYSLGKTVAF